MKLSKIAALFMVPVLALCLVACSAPGGNASESTGSDPKIAELIAQEPANADEAAAYDKLALGCPSMGDEVLEEDEMEPFFTALEGKISGKKVVLFGSYDWGDGQWMRDWQQRTVQAGAKMPADGLIVNLTPDEDGLAQCRELGAKIAE